MILALEYDSDGRLSRIVRAASAARTILDVLATGHRLDESDVNYCRRDDRYYRHEVGSWTGRVYLGQVMHGKRCKLWAREEATFSRASDGDRMIFAEDIAALGYDLVYGERPKLPYMEEGDCYWCEKCNDMLPKREPCDHVYWCDTCYELLSRKTERCEHYCDQCELTHAHYEGEH